MRIQEPDRQKERLITGAVLQIRHRRACHRRIAQLPVAGTAVKHLEAIGYIATADVPLAGIDRFVADFAQPLAQVGDFRVDGIAVDHHSVLFGHPAGEPACTRGTALGHRGIGFHKGVTFGHDSVYVRGSSVLTAVGRNRLMVHLVYVNEYYIGLLHANHLSQALYPAPTCLPGSVTTPTSYDFSAVCQ